MNEQELCNQVMLQALDKYLYTVCIDFDGVIHQYHGWTGGTDFNPPIPNAKKFIERLVKQNRIIIIYTCRNDTDAIKRYLLKYKIPFHFINENPYQPQGIHPSKIFAHAYVDDRAVEFKEWNEELLQKIEAQFSKGQV